MPPGPFRMSDFGITAPTASSNVQPSSDPTLEDLLFNTDMISSQAKRVSDLDTAVSAAEQEKAGFFEQLKDPRVLIPLLLGGVGAAVTGQPAALAGAGVGALQGATGLQQEEKAENLETVQRLKEERDQAQNDLDNSRNRLATIFNTNPEALVDSEGKPINSRVLGWYITGVPLGLSTVARRTAEERGAQWDAKMGFLSDSIKLAQSREEARPLVEETLKHIGWTTPAPETVERLIDTWGTPQFDKEFAATLLREGPNADAILFAQEHGLPLHDPKVLKMVKLYPPPVSGGSESLADRTLSLMDRASAWALDPANSQIVNELRSNATTPTEGAIAVARAALAANPLDAEYLVKAYEKDPTLAEIDEAYKGQVSKESGIERLKSYTGETYGNLMNETPDEARNRRMTNAMREVEEKKRAAVKNNVNSTLATRDGAARQISASLPSLGQSGVYALVDQVYRAALEDTPTDARGRKDMKTFNKLMAEYTKQAIEQNK